MTASQWRPWWERPDNTYGLDERDEFIRGATTVGFRPNNRLEAMVAMQSAGYIRNSFRYVKPHTGKKQQ